MGKIGDIGIVLGLGIVGGVIFMFATGRWKFPELKLPEITLPPIWGAAPPIEITFPLKEPITEPIVTVSPVGQVTLPTIKTPTVDLKGITIPPIWDPFTALLNIPKVLAYTAGLREVTAEIKAAPTPTPAPPKLPVYTHVPSPVTGLPIAVQPPKYMLPEHPYRTEAYIKRRPPGTRRR